MRSVINPLSRRRFLKQFGAVSLGFAGLRNFVARGGTGPSNLGGSVPGYGPLVKDPRRVMDLPSGFTYNIISETGQRMDDGFIVPGAPDGMATFAGPDNQTIIVRNHEISPIFAGDFSVTNLTRYTGGQVSIEWASQPYQTYNIYRVNQLLKEEPTLVARDVLSISTRTSYIDRPPFDAEHHFYWVTSNTLLEPGASLPPEKIYDVGGGGVRCLGGTTTMVYDTQRQQLIRQFLSLTGTVRNCAGGPTPWGSWLTCEESLASAGGSLQKNHGYVFDVPASATPGVVTPVALGAMGRFNHEAVAVNPATGIVYQTEDRGDSLIYRFIPNTPGDMADGGLLQVLAIVDEPSLDTRNWAEPTFLPGTVKRTAWIDLDEVDAGGDNLRYRGFDLGAARFARGEGMWYGNDGIYFVCTSGGNAFRGQIWKYTPSPLEGTANEADQPGTLELFIEPNNSALVDNPDNITVAPWGDLMLCEDGGGGNGLVGVTPQGETYRFAQNVWNGSEIAGACFSPDGTTLFVSIQFGPGTTLAITGPWVP